MSNTNLTSLSLMELDGIAGGVDAFEACAAGAAIGAGIGVAAGTAGGPIGIGFGGAIGAVAGCGVGLIAREWLMHAQ